MIPAMSPPAQAARHADSTEARRLENGLTLLLHPNREVPVATADVWVRTGSADETPEIGGISHFLEHMMFKGTERFAVGEIEREIENLGGVSNAATSYDFTHYHVTLPSENLERAIEFLGEMVRGSILDAKELEEYRGALDQALEDGSFFVAEWFHCAVGTNPG